MAKDGWKLSKGAITGSTRSLMAKNGRKWVSANQKQPTTLSVAIVCRYSRFWPKKHRELPFLAIALFILYMFVLVSRHSFEYKTVRYWFQYNLNKSAKKLISTN